MVIWGGVLLLVSCLRIFAKELIEGGIALIIALIKSLWANKSVQPTTTTTTTTTEKIPISNVTGAIAKFIFRIGLIIMACMGVSFLTYFAANTMTEYATEAILLRTLDIRNTYCRLHDIDHVVLPGCHDAKTHLESNTWAITVGIANAWHITPWCGFAKCLDPINSISSVAGRWLVILGVYAGAAIVLGTFGLLIYDEVRNTYRKYQH